MVYNQNQQRFQRRITERRLSSWTSPGVAAVDTKVGNHLLQTVAAAKLMGATVIVTGLSAEVSQRWSRLSTVGDLQGGIEDAERLLGFQVVANALPTATTTNGV
jgi:hypothetical protein